MEFLALQATIPPPRAGGPAGGRYVAHPEWLQGARPESRTWDLHLSYFGDRDDPFPDRPADVTLSFEKGTKAIGTVA